VGDQTRTISDAQTAAEPPPADSDNPYLAPGDTVGPYRLVRIVGEGGFGIVFEAERTHPIRQTVALKVLKPGMDSRAVLGRFEQERRALAVMDHPNLARVLDAGQTARGLPYFVMELVRGEPITEFCDRRNRTIRQRLELLIPVCEAVHHAHTKGIIHRDLKPGNILVSDHEGLATPKVIDFGIAKALGSDDFGRTLATEAGQLVGTPEYMSPEQADASADVDTRSDVYSLGIVVYELLVGALPFDSASLRSGGFLALQRAIRELPAQRASTRLLSKGISSAEIASRRAISLRDLQRVLRTELEWIPLKAVSKERERRYASAHALAEDLRAYLAGQPLIAGPESTSYRLRKLYQRNRVPAITGALLLFAVLAGLAGTGYGLLRAREHAKQEAAARATAEARLADVRRLANSLLFDLNADLERLPGSTGARKRIVDIGLSYLDKLAREDNPGKDLLAELASGYFELAEVQSGGRAGNVGDRPGALLSHEKALAIRRSLLRAHPTGPAEQRAVAESQLSRSHLLRQLDEPAKALVAAQEAVDLVQSLAQTDPSRNNRRLLSRVLTARAWALWSLDRFDESAQCSREVLAIDERLVAEDPNDWHSKSNLATSHADLGDLHEHAGRLDLARESHQRAVDLYREIRKLEPSNTEHTLSLAAQLRKLGAVTAAAGEYQQAEAQLAEALSLGESVARADPQNSVAETSVRRSLTSLGDLYRRRREWDRELEIRRRTLEIAQSRSNASPGDISLREDISTIQSEIVEVLSRLERRDEAIALARQVVGIDRAILSASASPERREYVAFSLSALGQILRDAGDLDAAADALTESLDIRRSLLDADPSNPRRKSNCSTAWSRLAVLETARGRRDLAIEHYRKASTLDAEIALADPGNLSLREDLFSGRESLALVLSEAGSHEEAIALITGCVEGRRTIVRSARSKGDLADAFAWRAEILLASGQGADAIARARSDLVEAVGLFNDPEVARALTTTMTARARKAETRLRDLPAP